MRPPKVENKYQLTMEIARNLDIGDETKVREPLFWRNDVVHAWCISKSIGSDRDRRFGSDNGIWVGIYDKNARKRDYISSFPVGAAWANMILTIFMKMLRKNVIWKRRRNF